MLDTDIVGVRAAATVVVVAVPELVELPLETNEDEEFPPDLVISPVSRLTPGFRTVVSWSTGPPALFFAADLRDRGALAAERFVPIDMTGFVGMMTTVPPPGEVVATVDD